MFFYKKIPLTAFLILGVHLNPAHGQSDGVEQAGLIADRIEYLVDRMEFGDDDAGAELKRTSLAAYNKVLGDLRSGRVKVHKSAPSEFQTACWPCRPTVENERNIRREILELKKGNPGKYLELGLGLAR